MFYFDLLVADKVYDVKDLNDKLALYDLVQDDQNIETAIITKVKIWLRPPGSKTWFHFYSKQD